MPGQTLISVYHTPNPPVVSKPYETSIQPHSAATSTYTPLTDPIPPEPLPPKILPQTQKVLEPTPSKLHKHQESLRSISSQERIQQSLNENHPQEISLSATLCSNFGQNSDCVTKMLPDFMTQKISCHFIVPMKQSLFEQDEPIQLAAEKVRIIFSTKLGVWA